MVPVPTVEEVNPVVSSLCRKYDWKTQQLGYGVKLTVNDGDKFVSVYITTGEDIEKEVSRAIAACDRHEYGELEG